MVVSLLRMVVDLPGSGSLKEKRRVISSLKERMQHKYHIAVAEVGRNDAWQVGEIGCATVSNSRAHGEAVMQSVIRYAESTFPLTIRSADIFSEQYGRQGNDIG
jgi:uncharacterized protein YlxP (DUF503 family)